MTEDKPCSHSGCTNTYRPHRWGKIKTHPDWFHQKDGTSWCPDHHPEWVAAWREKQAAGIPSEPWRR